MHTPLALEFNYFRMLVLMLVHDVPIVQIDCTHAGYIKYKPIPMHQILCKLNWT